MSVRLRIRHEVGATYDEPVSAAYSEVRLTPATTAGQTALRTRVDVRPTPWSQEYSDYWGTRVTAFEVHEPHRAVSVVATSTVEVDRPHVEPPGGTWDALDGSHAHEEHVEMLATDAATRPPPDLAARVRVLAAASAWPDDVALSVCALLRSSVVTVAQGAAGGPDSADAAWSERAASPRGLAHLALGALRTAGLPARFVSGYHLLDPGAPVGSTAAGGWHAWVEWWTGEWFGWDPTADRPPGDGHVVVARGRGHADVRPLAGVRDGGALPGGVPLPGAGVLPHATVALTRVA